MFTKENVHDKKYSEYEIAWEKYILDNRRVTAHGPFSADDEKYSKQ